jgi:hypothetical protein
VACLWAGSRHSLRHRSVMGASAARRRHTPPPWHAPCVSRGPRVRGRGTDVSLSGMRRPNRDRRPSMVLKWHVICVRGPCGHAAHLHRGGNMPYGHRGQVWSVLLALVVMLVVVGGYANDGGEDTQATLQPPPTAPFTPGPPETPLGPPGPSTPPGPTGGQCPVCPPPCSQCLVCPIGKKPCGDRL